MTLFTPEQLKGSKIVDIIFPDSSESYDNNAELSTTFVCDGDVIIIKLDNGLVLEFWNSEWGGMTVKKDESGYPHSGRKMP